MLNVIREGARTWASQFLIWFVAVTFVGGAFAVWGDGLGITSGSAVATVGEKIITQASFQRRVRQMDDMLRQQFGGEADSSLLESMNPRGLALNSLLDSALQVIAAKNAGIMVTDMELSSAIEATPDFYSAGVFDKRRYVEVLARNSISPKIYEVALREDLIIRKLRNFVERSVAVTEAEVLNKFLYEYQPLVVEYAKIDPKKFESELAVDDELLTKWFSANGGKFQKPEKREVSLLKVDSSSFAKDFDPSDDELLEYYDSNLQDYETEDNVTASHILIELAPDADDEEKSAASEKIKKAKERVDGGEDFAVVAKEMSEGPSAEQGGDLGSFGRGMMVPEFENVAFAQDAGSVSEPFLTEFGWHVVKTIAKTEEGLLPLDEVKDDVSAKVRTKRGKKEARAFVENLREELNPDEFLTIAKKHPEVQTESYSISRYDSFPGISTSADLVEAAFGLPEKAVSTSVDTGVGYALVMVDSVQLAHVPALETIKKNVELEYRESSLNDVARKTAEKIEKSVGEGKSIKEAALAEGVATSMTKPFSRISFNDKSFEKGDGVSTRVFDIADGEATTVFNGDSYIVVSISSRPPVDEKVMAEKLGTIKENTLERKRAVTFSEFAKNLRKEAEGRGEIEVMIDVSKPL